MAEELNFEDAWEQLIAKAWSDAALKAKLLADPAGVLKEQGLIVPAGMTVKVVENTDKVVNLVLPAKPGAEELSEVELQQAAGGHCRGCGGCGGCGGCRGCGGCGRGCRGCGGCRGCRD